MQRERFRRRDDGRPVVGGAGRGRAAAWTEGVCPLPPGRFAASSTAAAVGAAVAAAAATGGWRQLACGWLLAAGEGMLSPRPPPGHQTTHAGDHHHFVTPLRPGRAVPSCVAPSFHAAPKLRGSSRVHGRSSRVARGRSPARSSMASGEHSWGLNERPSQRARSRPQPALPAPINNALVMEPPIWRQLEALVTPRAQPQPQPRRPVPPPGEDAALRFVVEDELREIVPTSGHTEEGAMVVEMTTRDDAIWGQSPAKKIVPVSLKRIGGTIRDSAHSSRLAARVEDVHVMRKHEQAAVASLQGNKWTSPRRPHSQHAQRSAPSRQRDSAAAHKAQGPASPYNIEQYFRTMWDTDRAAALASAHRYRGPEMPKSPDTPRAKTRKTRVAAVAKSSEEGLVVKAIAMQQEEVAAPVSSERTAVYRLAYAPAVTQAIPQVHAEKQLHQQHKQQLLQQLVLQQNQQQCQRMGSSVLQVSSTSIGGSTSEQVVDGPASFVPSSWREVVQSEHIIAPGLLGTPVRHGKVKVRGGAFGRFEIQKAAETAAVHLQHGVHSSHSEGLQPPGPPAAVVASAQPDAVGRERVVTPSILNVLEDEQTQWSLGKGSGSPQTTAVAPDYSWHPIDSLAWIPGLVPARGPLLSPWPQPEPPSSPSANTGPLVASAVHISRPRTADMMEWTREGVKMNLAGPVIQVRGHHVEVAEVHHSPGISNADLQTRPQTAQVETQQHDADTTGGAQLKGQAELIAPVQAAPSREEALVGAGALDEANVEEQVDVPGAEDVPTGATGRGEEASLSVLNGWGDEAS